jgi:hypothetical protein
MLVAMAAGACSGGQQTEEKGNPGKGDQQGSGKPDPGPNEQRERRSVRLLLGQLSYTRDAAKLAVGTKAKFQGVFTALDTEGQTVVVSSAKLYSGDEPAVPATVLAKDVLTDWAAAAKKYHAPSPGLFQVVVEGVVEELIPARFAVILEGEVLTGEQAGRSAQAKSEQKAKRDLTILARAYRLAANQLQRPPGHPEELQYGIGQQEYEAHDLGRFVIRWGLEVPGRGQLGSVLAYEAQAPTKGGLVVFADEDRTTEKVSPGRFKELVPELPPQRKSSPYYVEVFLGLENLRKMGNPRPGQLVKVKAELVTWKLKNGEPVRLQLGEPYDGPEKAVKAADLTRDFATDQEAARKKYRRQEFSRDVLVVEGILRAVTPPARMVLDGHTP